MNLDSVFVWKFLKFGIVGVSGVAVDFGITWLVKEKLRLNPYLANSMGFTGAVFSNFALNRIWTFESHDPNIAAQFGKYAAFASVGLLLNNSIIYVLREKMGIPFYTAKLIATCIVMLWNFGANLLFTFK